MTFGLQKIGGSKEIKGEEIQQSELRPEKKRKDLGRSRPGSEPQ